MSAIIVAVLGGAVSTGYWYFVQRPIEDREQREAIERAEVRALYEDSRRLIVVVRQRVVFSRVQAREALASGHPVGEEGFAPGERPR